MLGKIKILEELSIDEMKEVYDLNVYANKELLDILMQIKVKNILWENRMGIVSYIKEEIRVVRERDPAIKSNMEVLLYPSFRVILRYRVAHKLYLKKHYF